VTLKTQGLRSLEQVRALMRPPRPSARPGHDGSVPSTMPATHPP